MVSNSTEIQEASNPRLKEKRVSLSYVLKS